LEDCVKTTTVESAERGRSPLGAYIRFLMDGRHGNMIHSTVPPGMVGRACRFRTIDEYWYVLSGEGEVWRRAPDGQESVTRLVPGVRQPSRRTRRLRTSAMRSKSRSTWTIPSP
jgi:hypothetical protein